MVYTQEPDKLITCPLEESHRILKSRMQFHLVRCLKNHNLGTRLKCPWNPLHIIDQFAYVDHYTRTCENIPGALGFLFPTEPPRDVGSVPVGATNDALPPTEEDWDADPTPVGTYDPSAYVEKNQLLRASVGLSKAKRKAYRQAERKRFQEIEDTLPIQTKACPPALNVSKREPRIMSKTLSVNTTLVDDLNSSRQSEEEKNIGKNKIMQASREPHRVHSPSNRTPDMSGGRNGAYRKQITNVKSVVLTDDDDDKDDKVPNLCRENSMIHHSDTEDSCLLDEAACLPSLVSSDDELVKRLAELDMSQKKIDQMRKNLYLEMSERDKLPKLISSNASITSSNQRDDVKLNGFIRNDEISPPSSCNSFFGMPNCAANFPKLTNKREPRGVGRGMVIDMDSSRNILPGQRRRQQQQQHIETSLNSTQSSLARNANNPFGNSQNLMGANTSQLTYTINNTNADDDDSISGYSETN